MFDIQNVSLIKYNGDCESVTVPEGVREIADFAFYRCTFLKSIIIPEGVETIGAYAFDGCKALERVALPSTLKAIEKDAFAMCDSLCELKLPRGLESIGASAFMHAKSLKDIELPDTLKSLGERAFYSCAALESLTLPQSLKTVGSEAFAYCRALSLTLDCGAAVEAVAFAKVKTITPFARRHARVLIASCDNGTLGTAELSIAETETLTSELAKYRIFKDGETEGRELTLGDAVIRDGKFFGVAVIHYEGGVSYGSVEEEGHETLVVIPKDGEGENIKVRSIK